MDEQKVTLGLLAFVALKELVVIVRTFILKSGDSIGDLHVRVAVLAEKVDQLNRQSAVTERDQKSIWREVDKLKK